MLRNVCNKYSKNIMDEFVEASTFLRTKLLLPFSKMNQTTNDMVKSEVNSFIKHNNKIRAHKYH